MARDQIRTLNRRVASKDSRVDQRQALVDLLERSLRLGHRRLAIRRLFMMEICGYPVPQELLEACAPLQQKVKATEVNRIRRSVLEWHAMISRPLAPTVAANVRLETVWR
jgi:hypothetical protein